ncbi:hypothetical protein EVAR_82969_1 [Eumeta japonica]|uniref:Uncharacterized protein n=1 Tax=Eumeta variegata TaxID=151549 RepID=A0A4C1VS37_EUMVA|nr:hypothetical protein EVAR_82969_1 [Eumeta japonica]
MTSQSLREKNLRTGNNLLYLELVAAEDVPDVSSFPRVLPTEGASALNARRRTLDCLAPAAPPRRGGSLRAPRHQPPPEKPSMAFCKRRLSWPEVDNSVNSGQVTITI